MTASSLEKSAIKFSANRATRSVCNQAGGVLDDVIVSRDAKHWLMVCNASNRDKLMAHFVDVRRKEDLDFDMADETGSTAMVAIQGPRVIEKLEQKLKLDIRGIKRYHFKTETIFAIVKLTIFRSGYTGEDGVELILPAKMTSMAMKFLGGQLEKADATLKPAGLGARDTLRLEAGMPLYGHELSEAVDPISAGLKWAVDLTKNFIGVESLRAIAEKGSARKLVGLELEGKRIARQASPVVLDGKVIGEITSGTLSPTLGKSIALAYVDAAHSAEGTALGVDLKGTINPATIVKTPFYKRAAT